MDQRVFLRLENGEIVTLDEAAVSGTSFVVQQDGLDAGTSYVVEKGDNPESTIPQQTGQTSLPDYVEAAVLNDVPIENDGAENIVYIVQQEGSSSESIQYAVVSEQGAIFTSENPSDDNISYVHDLSGIETLSRVATEEFTGTEILGTEPGSTNRQTRTKSITQNEKRNEEVKICFSCQNCTETFEDLTDFQEHMKTEHEEEMDTGVNDEITLLASCDLCSKSFTDYTELEAHRKTHTGNHSNRRQDYRAVEGREEGGAFKCSICGACFDDKNQRFKHIKTEHSRDELQEGSFTKCPFCHKLYVSRGSNRSLIKHIQSAHPGKDWAEFLHQDEKDEQLEEKIFCSLCGLGFYWRNSLVRHIKFRHPELYEEKGDEIFAELGIVGAQNVDVKQRRSITDEGTDIFECPKCPKKFLWIKSLKKHLDTSHNQTEKQGRSNKKGPVVFCCPYCSLVSKYACAVRKHLERKHSEHVKEVDITTVELPTMEAKEAMDIEFKTVDMRPAEVRLNFCPVIFRCPFCTYASKVAYNLVRHLTSVKHGNIFTFEELKDIGINSFKVRQDIPSADGEEKLDGTVNKKLQKLKLKAPLYNIIKQKLEILVKRTQENKENGSIEGDLGDIDIDDFVELAGSLDEDKGTVRKKATKEKKSLKQTQTTKKSISVSEKKIMRRSKGGKSFYDREMEKYLDGDDDDDFADEDEMFDSNVVDISNDDDDSSVEETMNESPIQQKTEVINVVSEREKERSKGIVVCSVRTNTPSQQESIKETETSTAGSRGKNISRESAKTDNTDASRKHVSIKSPTTDNAVDESRKQQKLDRCAKKASFHCYVCKNDYSHFEAFKQHLYSHINIKVFFRCKDCSYESPFFRELKSHLLQEHDKRDPDDWTSCLHTEVITMDSKPVTTYDCPYCEMLFSKAGTLQQHVLIDHSDNLESAVIKTEGFSTPKMKGRETVISSFNCKHCECLYHNINDIVKHMQMIHKDVDRSDLSNSNVRKSGRKRKLPKWLEDSTDDSNKTKRAKHLKALESTSTMDSLVIPQKETAKAGVLATSPKKKMTKEVIQEPSPKKETVKAGMQVTSVENVRDKRRKASTAVSEKVNKSESLRKEEVVKRKGKDIETQTHLVSKRASSETASGSGAASLEHRHVQKMTKGAAFSKDTSESLEEVENVNKCPHCDFVAKRSSALNFHINLKHGHEKIKDSRDDSVITKLASPAKAKPRHAVEDSNSPSIVKNKRDRLEQSAISCIKVKVESSDILQTANTPESEINKNSSAKQSTSVQYVSSGGAKAVGNVLDTNENEFEMVDELSDYQFGDSDDDYKPDKEGDDENETEFKSEQRFKPKKLQLKRRKNDYIGIDLYKCPFCDVVGDSKKEVVAHIKYHHVEKDVDMIAIKKYVLGDNETLKRYFCCPYCELKSAWKSVVVKHIDTLHKDVSSSSAQVVCFNEIVREEAGMKYQCVYCYWQYDRRADVLAHITESHPDQPTVTEHDIYEVDISEKVEDQFQCPYCNLISKYKRCVVRHVKRMHKDRTGFTKSDIICLNSRNSPTEGLAYLCPYCDFDTAWRQCVIRHVENLHPEITDFNSDYIRTELREKTLLELDDFIQGARFKPDQKYFGCPFCDSVSVSRAGIRLHVKQNHLNKEKQFECSQVREVVWDDFPVGDQVYKCPVCDSGSKQKKIVVLHVINDHPDARKFNVESCMATLKKNDEDESSIFMCKICNELFSSTKHVNTHALQLHSTEKQVLVEAIPAGQKIANIFRCIYCSHTSSCRNAIIHHVKVHHPHVVGFSAKDVICDLVEDSEATSIGGYQCPYCDTVNYWKKSIIRHVRTVHKDLPFLDIPYNPVLVLKNNRRLRKGCKHFTCQRCGLYCRSIGKMKRHFILEHPKHAKKFLSKENTEVSYESPNILEFNCVLCNSQYMWKKSLLTHVRRQHAEMFDVYQAVDQMVDTVTASAGLLERTVVEEIQQPVALETKAVLDKDSGGSCVKCGKDFKTKWALNVHNGIKHGLNLKLRFKCNKCGLSFHNQALLLRHKRTRHTNKPSRLFYCNMAACKYRCKFLKILQNHYKIEHKIQIPLSKSTTFTNYNPMTTSSTRCEICLRNFSNSLQLKQHFAIHNKKRRMRFQCGMCNQQFLTRLLRDMHIDAVHPDKAEVVCDICGALCLKKYIRKHMRSHDEESSEFVPCTYCNKIINSKMFTKHLNEHLEILNCECGVCRPSDGEAVEYDEMYPCTLCKQAFCQKPMLNLHRKLKHNGRQSKLYYCKMCPDLVFLSKAMEEAHCHEHHKKKLDETKCISVSQSYSTQLDGDPTTHVIHIGQDEGRQFLPKLSESSMNAVIKELVLVERGVENPFKCLLCSRSFSRAKYIKLHIRRAHVKDEDQPYRCKVCGSGFVRLTEFRKHSRSHSDFRPYKCRYCDKAFKQQANLRDHYRVHTNKKEYECYICKSEFKQRGGLTSHVVFHDTLKPFKCMYCQKGHTTRGDLSRHMQKYNKGTKQSTEKSYPCHICEETYPHYPMLLKHIEGHNPDKPFQCEVCQEKFSNYVSMYFHKVKLEHFLLKDIQTGMNQLKHVSRKFRAHKKHQLGPEVVYSSTQPTTSETIYMGQPDTFTENDSSIKPVEVIIEGFGKDQVVRIAESQPEQDELLSIAKQLTELSGFQGSEYYTNKKNIHQEEDQIIKDMLDADAEVIANLTKQVYNETDNTDWNKAEDESQEYVKDVKEINESVDSPAGGYEDFAYIASEADRGQDSFTAVTRNSIPTNMEELVSLVSENSTVAGNDQVMAYQNEDGSVIYVCLSEGQTDKPETTSQENTEAGEIIIKGDEAVIPDKTGYDLECTEEVDNVYEETSESAPEQSLLTEANGNIGESITTSNVDNVQIPSTIQVEALTEFNAMENMDTDENVSTVENTGIDQHLKENIDSDVYTVTHEGGMQAMESNETETTEYMNTEPEIQTSDEQQGQADTQSENNMEEGSQNQKIAIVRKDEESTVITIQAQETQTENKTESQEELIRRSHLARHLTGNVGPQENTSRIQTSLIVTDQGLQSMDSLETIVPQDVRQSETMTTNLMSIPATAADHTQDDPASSFSQAVLIRQEDSFVEGTESLVEYQIDESRFIKEELLDAEYSGMSEKDREVLFFSDNIYTYSHMEKKFICLHCGAKIGTFKNLKNHIRRHAPVNSRTHACTFCPKKFVTKNELKRHLCTHTGERNYECNVCGKKFIQPGHLQEHLRLHTGHKPFPCTDCNAAFITKSQLVLHFSRMHSSHEIPCNMCERVFKNAIDLRRHKGLEHSGTKAQSGGVKEEAGDHICYICGSSFMKKAYLKKHLEKHNMEELEESEKAQEMFQCEECGVAFKSKYYVKEHVKMAHTKAQNEVCEICGDSFITKGKLRRHKLNKHPEPSGESSGKWNCKICNKALGSKYAYGYHMGSKHPNVLVDD